MPAECRLSDYERLKVKMRMFARFIGMQGAETPSWEFDRQVEIMESKLDQSIEEEERQLMGQTKFYGGPALP